MSKILEYNEALGQIVPVDISKDREPGDTGLYTAEQSMIPGVAKDLTISGPMEDNVLLNALSRWHTATHRESGTMAGALGAAAWKPSKKPATARLQKALRDLSATVNTPALAVSVDSVVGPKTQAAVNLAFAKYLKLPANFGTLPLSLQTIETKAELLAIAIENQAKKAAEIQKSVNAAIESLRKRGFRQMSKILEYNEALDQIVPVDISKDREPGDTGLYTAEQSMIPGVAKDLTISGPMEDNVLLNALSRWHTATHRESGTMAGALGAALASLAIKGLQNSLNKLAGIVKDATITVKADGIMGPKTQAATNRAMLIHLKAKLSYPLSQTGIKSQAQTFTKMIDAWISQQLPKSAPIVAKPAAAWKPSKKPATARLQKALRDLSATVNTPALAVSVDSVVGPKTQAAVNLAFAKYLKLPANFGTLPLSLQTIETKAELLAIAIENQAAGLRVIAQKKAAEIQKSVNAAKATAPAKAPEINRSQVVDLQKALAALSAQVKNSALKVKVDGIMGPKTQNAVNLALSRYVAGVSAAMKTGKLSQSTIINNGAGIAVMIAEEVERRISQAQKPKVSPVGQSQSSAVSAQKQVENVKAVAPAVAEKIDRESIKLLQNAVNSLSNVVKNPGLAVTVDGIVGTKTRAAVNLALNKYVAAATAKMRAGYTIHEIQKASVALAKLISDEVIKRNKDEIARKSTLTLENETPALSYIDERTITMPLDMLEDNAELGAQLALGEYANVADFADADLGAQLALGETGFFKKIKRAAKRVSRVSPASVVRSAKRVAKKGARVVKAVGKLSAKLAAKLVRRYALPLAKLYCRLPPAIQSTGVRIAGVDPKLMVAFCHAIKVRNMRDIMKLFPVAMKVSTKLAVQGQFPAAAPILKAIKLIPGVKSIPGMSWIAGANLDAIPSTLGDSLISSAIGADLLISDPMAMYDDLDKDTTMDGDLSGPLSDSFVRDETGCNCY